ncbi:MULTISPECIES: L-aspartate oxidase [Rhodomicrobium]|uniref:L-aspartate oxidase n=1 Tax=Rhodomicrobium sp. R_RK_3 TaxID=2029567 RepID=UPI001FD8B20C|nr:MULTISPECIES: L-aspartate oxidase [Rhodomicrobium]
MPDPTVIIIGGGLAGLFAALRLAPTPVTIVTPRPLGEGASSAWAQAGIAVAIGQGDSFEQHAADTIRAGAGLCDLAMVRLIVGEGPARIEDLLRYGVPFDRDLEGRLRQSREAAHSARRVIGVRGDQAGKAIMAALITTARNTPSITVLEEMAAVELALADGRVTGVFCAPSAGAGFVQPDYLPARAVVLATGGIGQLFTLTTNPPEARGDGIAMAARAGAVVADAEFVQFHPTALDIGKHPAPLATEALRGEGATLVNSAGERFMLAMHPEAELAPRDVVARAVQIERASGRGAFLDCRGALGAGMAEHFPTVYAACAAAGIAPAIEPIPIAPAAHYYMGGVATDANARSSLPGLWAIGEAASTGLHGANRLASNSLLEAVVMAARAAEDIAGLEAAPAPGDASEDGPAYAASLDAGAVAALQEIMTAHVGVVRSAESLVTALHFIEAMRAKLPPASPLANMTEAARFMTVCAMLREESRGSHYRSDFPETGPQARRSMATQSAVLALSADILGGY